MILSADRESNRVFAAVQNDGKTERYECIISVCPNPVCTCNVVSLDLLPERTQSQDPNWPHPRRVVIDLVEKRLSFKKGEKISKDDLDFARLFLSKLEEGNFNLLYERYLSLKNEFSESAAPGSIDANFEYHKIETDGLLVAYNDVLPYGDQMFVTIGGKQYAVLDQFCLQPHCPCEEMILTIMALDGAGKKAEEICAIALNYGKRQWGKVMAYSDFFFRRYD